MADGFHINTHALAGTTKVVVPQNENFTAGQCGNDSVPIGRIADHNITEMHNQVVGVDHSLPVPVDAMIEIIGP
jgi:hypothetical protein